MANVALSARIKKLTKDFELIDGKVQMPLEKMHTWLGELEKVAKAEKKKVAEELVALAMKFEREGKELAEIATAQLYTFAAGILKYGGPDAGKATAPTTRSEAKTKPEAPAAKKKTSGSWGAKPKR
jgi:hypothetical protein